MTAHDRIFEDFHQVVEETEQLLRSVASLGPDIANVLRGNVQQALAVAAERLAEIRARSNTLAAAAANVQG